MAGEPGFEPRPTESESVVLPLNYSPKVVAIINLEKLFAIKKAQNNFWAFYFNKILRTYILRPARMITLGYHILTGYVRPMPNLALYTLHPDA